MMSKCTYYLSCLCLPLFVASCSCTKEHKTEPQQISEATSEILTLTNIQELQKFDYAIVKFYLPGCPACKMSTPVYAELSKKCTTVTFLEADVAENENLATEFSIRSVPTFIVFKKGEKGERLEGFNKAKLEQMLNNLCLSQPAVSTTIIEIADQDQFKKELAEHPRIIVKCYANWCGFCQLIAPEYENIAHKYNNITCLAIEIDHNKELAMQYAPDGVPTFISFKNGKEMKHFSGAVKSELERMAQELAEQQDQATAQVSGPIEEEAAIPAVNDTED